MTGRTAIILLLVCMLIVTGFAVETKMTRDEALLAFAEANRAFRQANESTSDPQQARQFYEQTILEYEKIISDGGIKNAKLYYNLANAYQLKGDLGKAILNYRRALRLDLRILPASPVAHGEQGHDRVSREVRSVRLAARVRPAGRGVRGH